MGRGVGAGSTKQKCGNQAGSPLANSHKPPYPFLPLTPSEVSPHDGAAALFEVVTQPQAKSKIDGATRVGRSTPSCAGTSSAERLRDRPTATPQLPKYSPECPTSAQSELSGPLSGARQKGQSRVETMDERALGSMRDPETAAVSAEL
ncbi:uncharacterized protein LOC134537268 [Bacillus rossius redtenbacheri]|uniref:uncharacterized protein LOC134537268 n=1 Tax=Bacillus rossius redtenbacheri TaxID=93214 RepID=UPI002FDD9BF8